MAADARPAQPVDHGPGGARVEPPVALEGPLRALAGLVHRADALVDRFLPEELNPLAQTGAIANTSLLVAVASGVLLLFWWSSSVHHAHESIATMGFFGRWLRALHRYSSDASMLFVLLHALRLFAERRFGGARWLAWVTGALLVATLWLVGWLGYWLTWDERGKQVALGTARFLDALPVFADPLSRSFLADDTVNSLVFFIVFFFHMLIPLAMGIALWLHITRLSRSGFLTGRSMTLWVVGTQAVLSLVPADLAAPARMAITPDGFPLDAWYLAPMALTDRLGAGALWAIALVGAVVAYSIPWSLARGRRAEVSVVREDRCNACTRCYQDCPYDAIRMVPRKDPSRFAEVASVDASKCVGCGICAGSCDSAGIGLEWFDAIKKRAELDRFVDGAAKDGAAYVAFVCGESAGRRLTVDRDRHTCAELEGWRVMTVPCVGWVHALTVERALRHGAEGVLLVGCGAGAEPYREGPKWTHERMSGARPPSLDTSKLDASKVRVVELHEHDLGGLRREADALRAGRARATRSKGGAAAFGVALAVGLMGVTWALSRVGYAVPAGGGPELVVSFKHPGQVSERCRDLTEEEKQKLPPHMRQPKVCERGRVDVRMRVTVDGARVVDKAYAPKGLWHDGNSLAVERVPVGPGPHHVEVAIGDGPDPDEYAFTTDKTVTFAPRTAVVVRFDKVAGFEWP